MAVTKTSQHPVSHSRLNQWSPAKPEQPNSASVWRVCPPPQNLPTNKRSRQRNHVNARSPGQWIPQFVGGIHELDATLTEATAPLVYLTAQGEVPELYGSPFNDMRKYSFLVAAAPCKLSRIAQAPGTRAIEFKRPKPAGSAHEPAGSAHWRVRVFVEVNRAHEFDEWCSESEAALWVGATAQDANLVRVPDAHLDELVSCAKSGNSQRARQLIDEITSTGGTPDQFAWSALLSAYAKADSKGDLTGMHGVMADMERAGVAPNAHGFNAVAGAYSRAGKAESIRALLPQMVKAGIAPNVYIFTSLVASYGKSRRPEDASRVLTDMADEGVEPNTATYNALISAWCKSSKEGSIPAVAALQRADEVLEKMELSAVAPDNHTFTTLMAGHSQAGNPHAAARVMAKMESSKLQADDATRAVVEQVRQTLQHQEEQTSEPIQIPRNSRAATSTERSQRVSQWRQVPDSNCKICHKQHDTQSCPQKTNEQCADWRLSRACQYGTKCRYMHAPQEALSRTHTFPLAHSSSWRESSNVTHDTSRKRRQIPSERQIPSDVKWSQRPLGFKSPETNNENLSGSFENGEFVCAEGGDRLDNRLQARKYVPQRQQTKGCVETPSTNMRATLCCKTCGTNFGIKDVTSFEQHQQRCSQKGSKADAKRNKSKSSNNNWRIDVKRSRNICPTKPCVVVAATA